MGTIIDTRDITLGIGVLRFGTYNTSDVFGGYSAVGAIKGTFSVNITRETRDFETGRPLVVVKREVLRERVEVTFTMAEWRVANLKLAFGGGVVSSSITPAAFIDGTTGALKGDLTDSIVGVSTSDEWTIGGQCDLDKVGLQFVHIKSCSNGRRQIVEVYLAQVSGQAALPFNEEDWNMLSISFLALADTTRSAGQQYLRFVDERD